MRGTATSSSCFERMRRDPRYPISGEDRRRREKHASGSDLITATQRSSGKDRRSVLGSVERDYWRKKYQRLAALSERKGWFRDLNEVCSTYAIVISMQIVELHVFVLES